MKTIKKILSLFIIIFVFPAVAYSDCRGCCSGHGGVVCIDNVTQCDDGSPLSEKCKEKGCNQCSDNIIPPDPKYPDPVLPEQIVDENSNTIKIASFNIRIFGKTKAANEVVMNQLVKIINKFDIVAIQEIRDISGTAIEELENIVDQSGVDYQVVVGPRLGRTSSKEQYAYFYRTSKIVFASAYTYDDTNQDMFHREPFIAKFHTTNGHFDFVLLTIHTDPDEATEEINALPLVISDAQDHFSDEQDFIILGDLNADCNYYDEDDPNNIIESSDYYWLINDGEDTNVASSSCTYDRIIVLESSMEDVTGNFGVYRYDLELGLTPEETSDVSDHYPVWAEFYIDKDSDTEPVTVED
ncbi:MAG: endonuclease/exonuclease/phosphatase family protein [Thermodesulfobacteriota bacterium]|nr:endonuclease/exonuclease/phosphatase family protein [Thermodesulfobacteriota bacterium]